MCCHVQALKHSFSSFVEEKYRNPTVINIDRTKPVPLKTFFNASQNLDSESQSYQMKTKGK